MYSVRIRSRSSSGVVGGVLLVWRDIAAAAATVDVSMLFSILLASSCPKRLLVSAVNDDTTPFVIDADDSYEEEELLEFRSSFFVPNIVDFVLFC